MQERLQRVWVDLATGYDLDGIHHDFIRFATSAFDYSRSSLERFQAWVRPLIDAQGHAELVAEMREDPYAMADALPELWDRFRRDNVTDLVRSVYREAKARRPHLVVSAAVLPDWRAAASWQFQDWSSWLADGILDVAVPMAYTGDDEQFGGWIDRGAATAGAPGRVWAGVGAYRNPVNEPYGRSTWHAPSASADRGVRLPPGLRHSAAGWHHAIPGTDRRRRLSLSRPWCSRRRPAPAGHGKVAAAARRWRNGRTATGIRVPRLIRRRRPERRGPHSRRQLGRRAGEGRGRDAAPTPGAGSTGW